MKIKEWRISYSFYFVLLLSLSYFLYQGRKENNKINERRIEQQNKYSINKIEKEEKQMKYEQFYDELRKQLKTNETSEVKCMLYQKGYEPKNVKEREMVKSANMRLVGKDYKNCFLEDFVILSVISHGIKVIAYLPTRGLYDYYQEGGWKLIMDTIKEIVEKMKVSC